MGIQATTQMTIPYLNARPLTATTWLSGVGIHLRGHPGYGGYKGLPISSYDFTLYTHLLEEPYQ